MSRLVTLPFVLAASMAATGTHAAEVAEPPESGIHLELRPRICTLSAKDTQCETRVQASWRSPRPESLCLILLDHPNIRRCWENLADGTYAVELAFSEDLTFQLRDPALEQVLATEVLRVIREALHYRHKRRDPWNIFS